VWGVGAPLPALAVFPWVPLGPPCSSWLLLAPPGSCWLLLAPLGCSWLLLGSPRAPGSPWLLLAPPPYSRSNPRRPPAKPRPRSRRPPGRFHQISIYATARCWWKDFVKPRAQGKPQAPWSSELILGDSRQFQGAQGKARIRGKRTKRASEELGGDPPWVSGSLLWPLFPCLLCLGDHPNSTYRLLAWDLESRAQNKVVLLGLVKTT
jgi:hypothetical protein